MPARWIILFDSGLTKKRLLLSEDAEPIFKAGPTFSNAHLPEIRRTIRHPMEWFDQIVFWHWWILAGALVILELTWPLFFFLWLGFSAAAVGFLLLAFPELPVSGQMLLFGVLSVAAIYAWRHYREHHPHGQD